MSGDGPAGSTSDVACRDVAPEWGLFEAALVEPEEGCIVAGFDGEDCAPASPEPLPKAGAAAPDPVTVALLPASAWPGVCPLPGADPADPSVAGAPGAGAAGGVPGLCGGETLADGLLDGVLVCGAVGSGVLGSGLLGWDLPGSGLPDSGSVGSGLLRDGGCDGVGVASSSGSDGEGLSVEVEPTRLSSTSPRPRDSEPWFDGGVDAAEDNLAAACEAGTPAVTASTIPSAAAVAPRLTTAWRPVFVVDTLDLKITMVIEPSRNRPAGKTG